MSPFRNRRTIVFAAALLLTVGAFATNYAQADKPPLATGAANLHQTPTSGVLAKIRFVDTGTTLQVRGRATGLDPNIPYFSLVYDAAAKPSGPRACVPSGPGMLTGAQMFVGGWTVDANGNGTLSVDKAGPSYVPLAAVGAMSIRVFGAGTLQACGEVHGRP